MFSVKCVMNRLLAMGRLLLSLYPMAIVREIGGCVGRSARR